MQECSSLECFVRYIVNVDTERCGATFQFGLMSDLTLLKKYVENFFRDFHARVACITLEVEPFVLFRFMLSLFIKSRRVWVKARHLGLQEGLFWAFGFALNLSTLMKYMCCFFFFLHKFLRNQNSAADNLSFYSCLPARPSHESLPFNRI